VQDPGHHVGVVAFHGGLIFGVQRSDGAFVLFDAVAGDGGRGGEQDDCRDGADQAGMHGETLRMTMSRR
jgi:hypothetical protein